VPIFRTWEEPFLRSCQVTVTFLQDLPLYSLNDQCVSSTTTHWGPTGRTLADQHVDPSINIFGIYIVGNRRLIVITLDVYGKLRIIPLFSLWFYCEKYFLPTFPHLLPLYSIAIDDQESCNSPRCHIRSPNTAPRKSCSFWLAHKVNTMSIMRHNLAKQSSVLRKKTRPPRLIANETLFQV